ncbi:MAG: hypothetical protein PHE06_04340 [Lachnospiraceae bacterium]|nr:hypothetical protein [Lachnospiraceae bacterium]
MEETHIMRSLNMAGAMIQYDAYVKNLLADKTLLAHILKAAVSELKGKSIKEIISCLGDEIQISRAAVAPGETDWPEKIGGTANEDTIPQEGKITYDIRFHLWLPADEDIRIKVLMNLEAQKDMEKPYDMVTRGIFYGARMISAQLDTEFRSSEYQNIKKVYSIWICMNSPQYIGNGISRYSITKQDLMGITPDHPESYDKMAIVMIYLNQQKEPKGKNIFHLLNALLSPTAPMEQKRAILQEFDIAVSKKMEKEINEMCNLGEGIAEKAIKQGLELGNRQGLELGTRQGLELGTRQGLELGTSRMLQLIAAMSHGGELALLPRLSQDVDFLEEMFVKYHIS